MKNYVMTQPKKNVITIVGTTGVGKSQVCENSMYYESILTFFS